MSTQYQIPREIDDRPGIMYPPDTTLHDSILALFAGVPPKAPCPAEALLQVALLLADAIVGIPEDPNHPSHVRRRKVAVDVAKSTKSPAVLVSLTSSDCLPRGSIVESVANDPHSIMSAKFLRDKLAARNAFFRDSAEKGLSAFDCQSCGGWFAVKGRLEADKVKCQECREREEAGTIRMG